VKSTGCRPRISRPPRMLKTSPMSKDDLRKTLSAGPSCGGLAEGCRNAYVLPDRPETPDRDALFFRRLDQWGECMADVWPWRGQAGDVIQITPSFGLFNGDFGFYHGAVLSVFCDSDRGRQYPRADRLAKDFKTKILTGVVSYGIRVMEVSKRKKPTCPT